MYQLPPASKLSTLPDTDKVRVLDHLFEPCRALSELLISGPLQSSYESYPDFIERSRAFLLDFLANEEKQAQVSPTVSKIISAHPRLGPSKDKLSSHSSSEQKSLAGTEEEAQKLAELNEIYEKTFPGLRYVVFVNGRSRQAIMQNMKDRIARRDISLERKEAFNAMCDIALDRARKLGTKL